MIVFFPAPYKDELAYSIVSRYHIWSSNISKNFTKEDLFSKKVTSIKIDFFQNIETLVKNLSHFNYLTSEEFLKNHTMFEYYNVFLNFHNKERLKEIMLFEDKSKLRYLYDTKEISLLNHEYLKYCPLCTQEEIRKFGEPYWHIAHNLPGVLMCVKHEQILNDSDVLFNGKGITAALENKCYNNSKQYPKKYVELLLKVCKESKVLLEKGGDFSKIINSYCIFLFRGGYIDKYGGLKIEKLHNNFINFFESEFLEILKITVCSIRSKLVALTESRMNIHPIYHILFIIFMNKKVENILETGNVTPFGEIPFKCKNIACENYLKNVIYDFDINFNNNKLIGTFLCDCGFFYRKNYSKRYNNSTFEILAFGQVWRKYLYHLVYIKDYSLKYIEKLLNITSRTLYYELLKPFPFEQISDSEKIQYRFASINPHLKLFKNDNQIKVLTWLMRNDINWARNEGICV